MYEVGTAREVRAYHRMPVEGPEGELHAHDYRLEVVVRRRALDDQGMVVDLDVLDAALDEAASAVADRDLERIRPTGADAVTVEVFARWLHSTLSPVGRAAGVDELAVRVWESPVAFGGYVAPPSRSSA